MVKFGSKGLELVQFDSRMGQLWDDETDKGNNMVNTHPIIFDAHQEILDEYVYNFILNEKDAVQGKRHIFDEIYLPLLKKQRAK